MNLDTELVAKAREVLGTDGITDTVHKALESIVLRDLRRRAATLRFDDLDAEQLEKLRAWPPS